MRNSSPPSTLNHCDVQEGWLGSGQYSMGLDPLFVRGALHNYYLSQTTSYESVDSPCADPETDTREKLGLDDLSTRTEGLPDESSTMNSKKWCKVEKRPMALTS